MSKRSKTLLTLSVVLVVISVLVSGAVQSSFGAVDVREISLVTGVGTLTVSLGTATSLTALSAAVA